MGRIVYLVQDLLFTSKIRETARQVGVEVTPARDPAALVEAARAAQLVILDLRLPSALDALDRLAADPDAQRVPSVGYIDHERVEQMEQARRKGCGTVLAKGKFTSELPALLRAAAS